MKFKGRVNNSPLFGMIAIAVTTLMLLMSMSSTAQIITTKVYRQKNSKGNFYGKLHIPQGGRYKIAMYPKENVLVGVFRAHIDGQNIYLGSLDPYGGTYWIDATEVDQNFLVRNSDGSDVIAVPVTDEEVTMMKKNRWFFYDKSDARRNSFEYSETLISNTTLREDAYFAGCPVYVMANPAKYGLTFVWINSAASTVSVPAGSLYVVGEEGSRIRQMNIVFEDDVDTETTGINDQRTAGKRQTDNNVYTLQGVRVNEPVKGSLYIRNGRKYVAE